MNIPENLPTAKEVQNTEVAKDPCGFVQLRCFTVKVIKNPA
jgi:hypothetical protein